MADPLLGFQLAQQGINLASGVNQNTASSRPGAPQPSRIPAFKVKEKLLRPALTSNYQCWFNPPEPVRDWIKNNRNLDYNFNAELISLSCSEASLPGSSMMTNEIIDDHTGVTERPTYRRQYDDRADFTFYIDHGRNDGNYNVLWFFENWLAYIVDEDYSKGLERNNYFYRVNFPDDYRSEALYINKFERDFAGQYLEYRFLQAYPISISSMPISYESSQLLKCTVSFTYTRYLIRRIKNSNILSRSQEPLSSTPLGIPDPLSGSLSDPNSPLAKAAERALNSEEDTFFDLP
jgi:hypothetical protein